MRLYLSSYQWGNRPEKIFELLRGGSKHVALLTNAADLFPEAGILERLQADMDFFEQHGYTTERLDLRDYFKADTKALRDKLLSFGLIWVRGANVYVLRRAMQQSGFDVLIKRLLVSDKVAYGGFSAGACVMGSTLHGLELVDDAKTVPENYDSEVIWQGLNILPYAIAPHYRSDHPESGDIDKTVAYYEENNIPFRALQDGQAIYVNGDISEIVG